MRKSNEKVLKMLRKHRKRGVAFDDFARGFRLGARIYDLRREGYGIVSMREPLDNGAYRARYMLLQDKQP